VEGKEVFRLTEFFGKYDFLHGGDIKVKNPG
jgi:hypothetical protein